MVTTTPTAPGEGATVTITMTVEDADTLSCLAEDGLMLGTQHLDLETASLTPEYRARLIEFRNEGRRIIDALDKALVAALDAAKERTE